MKIAPIKISFVILLQGLLFTTNIFAFETIIKKIDSKKEIITLDNPMQKLEAGDLIKVSGNCVLEVFEVKTKTVKARSELCIQKEDIVLGKVVQVEKISSDSQVLTQVDAIEKKTDKKTEKNGDKNTDKKAVNKNTKNSAPEVAQEEPIEDILKRYSNYKRKLSEKWTVIGSVSNMLWSVESQNQLTRVTTVEDESSILMGAGFGYNQIPVEGWGYQAQAHFLISDSDSDFSKFLRLELNGVYGTSQIYFMRAGFNLLKSMSDMSEPLGFGTQVGIGAQLNLKTAFVLSYTQSILKKQVTRNNIEYEISTELSGLELQWNYSYDIFGR